MNPVILLDRDGIINQDSMEYIKSLDEFIPIPENVQAIAHLTRAGYRIGIASNQSGVSRGLYTEETLRAIHNKMLHIIEEAGGRIDEIVYCIHMPETQCLCRKPQPGMLKMLADRFQCDLTGLSFVGDRVSDLQAALAVGAKPIIVLSSMTDKEGLKYYPEVPVYNSLMQYVNELLDDRNSYGSL